MEKFDYIVVGGGSSGCVTAARLVRDYGAKVLLLEGGWSHHHPFIRMPAGFVRILTKTNKFATVHVSKPQEQLGGRRIEIAQGNVLGGGSSINAMTYARGMASDYDGWDASMGGNTGWGWSDLLPYFTKQEANQRLAGPLHGVSGPMKVSDSHHPASDISRAYLLTLQRMGLPYNDDLNSGDERGVAYIQSATYHGERWGAARGFIEPIEKDPNLVLRHRSRVTKVLTENGKATGVEYLDIRSGKKRAAYTDGEVILTSGALVTPQLLMLSGIGAEGELRKHGIATVTDLPGVGKNLQDHYAVSLTVGTKENYGFSNEDRGLRMLKNGLQYLLFRSGPVSSTGSEVTGFFNPADVSADPTLQLYCMGAILNGSRAPQQVGATLTVNLVAPQSRGSVTLHSADPLAAPVINPNWFSAPEDTKNLLSGFRFLREVLKTAPLSDMATTEITPGPSVTSDEDIEAYMKKTAGTNWHPVGTCKMGPDGDPDAVLDDQLRVRGIEGLRVFDTSMMPRIIRANTNAAAMAVADKAVDLMMRH